MGFKNFYKYFFNFLIGLAFIILNIINQYAHAKDLSDLSELAKASINTEIEHKFSVGAEYMYIIDDVKDDWRKMLQKTQSGANLYVGYNWPYIMLEIGYIGTTRKSKEFLLNTGDVLFGQTYNGVSTVVAGQVRHRSTHFDLNFFANVIGDFDLVTSAGISFARPHVTVQFANNPNLEDIVVSKTTAVPKVGLGFRYLFTNTFGVRCMWHFDQNSKIRIRYSNFPGTFKPFRDANTFSIGLFGGI
jgi:hypothetical protein